MREKRIEGIADLRDECDRDGMRIVIELKRDASADVVLNQLYRYTPLQTSFGVNMLALNRGRPEQMGLREMLDAFVDFREEVVVRRIKFELAKARDRGHVLVGLAIAVANIDEVIHIIRSSKPIRPRRASGCMAKAWPAGDMIALVELIADPRTVVIDGDKLRLTDEQARAILALTLSRLTGLGRDEIFGEARELADAIQGHLDHPVGSRERIMAIVREELVEVRGRVRRAAPHRDRRRRRRHRGRGPDRPRGHGRHRHPRRLRQAHAAERLSDPAPRRQGPLGHGDEGRGRRHPACSRPSPTRRCCSSPPTARPTS